MSLSPNQNKRMAFQSRDLARRGTLEKVWVGALPAGGAYLAKEYACLVKNMHDWDLMQLHPVVAAMRPTPRGIEVSTKKDQRTQHPNFLSRGL